MYNKKQVILKQAVKLHILPTGKTLWPGRYSFLCASFAALREGKVPGSLRLAPFDKLRDHIPHTTYPTPINSLLKSETPCKSAKEQ